ncbi:Phosphatidylinositol kinase (PIK-F) [Plasmopara halstedii]|uniref:Phosphatidylinositol kinase (PIK-F) n=1 Tax=Plasmopara halstedii TaxID=4781 RepID=A0A0P1AGB7_PLAHL|nr:Phosphatidylinositol kinase (PIK-F) [Plasmopara halstedii]CEG40159.1 Phosphatidylinositol kinase (PIK-F) [Plasmopara halstedii]|eukprot:XP_024576528.1 Phosphatidylinositol kinase (PIK-F) [Plasmopara halstedii]
MPLDEVKTSRSLPGGWLERGHGAVVIFIKDFRDPLERRKKLLLRPWASIKDVKDQLQVVFNVPSNAQKLFYQGRELKNAHNLQQCGIDQDNAVVDFVARKPQNLDIHDYDGGYDSSTIKEKSRCIGVNDTALSRVNGRISKNLRPDQVPVVNIHPYGVHLLPVTLMKVTHQALQGLALGLAPVLAMDGTGGTYFFKDPSHRNVGCFKPQDEEPFGPNNPRGLVGHLGQSGLRRGILSGEACERELAAYILDKDHFAGVPATSLVESRHPVFNYSSSAGALYFKIGSFQEFVRHDDVTATMQIFSCVNDGHLPKITQTQEDADRLAEQIPLRRACRRNMIIASMVVQRSIRADLKLFEIARFMCREDLDAPSTLEQLCIEAFHQLQVVKQRKQNDALFYNIHIPPPNALAGKASESVAATEDQRPVPFTNLSSNRVPFRNLQVSIDPSCCSEAYCFEQSPSASGAQSPPGFWASFAPFSSEKRKKDKTTPLDNYSGSGDREKHFEMNPPRTLRNWDEMALTALSDAAHHASGGYTKSIASPIEALSNDHETSASSRSPISSFISVEDDKNDFEILNDALDDDVQDENLFLSILSRLLDERIEIVKSRQVQEFKRNQRADCNNRIRSRMSKNSHDDVPNLWTCARSSEATPILARLLRDEAPPDDRNDYGETALHVAASHGNDKAVILLLQYGADIMGADWESGWTPLHRSLYHQHLSTSLLLLRHAQMRFGRKFLRKYLYETIDHSQQSPLQLLSTRLQRESKHVSNTANSHNGGLVYTFGKRDYQLGYHLPNADMQVTPRLVNIPASSPITQVSASKYHTIALNAAGECFVWGFGKGGRLGTGNEFDCIEPTRLTSLETTPIKKVAAGENHTMALSRTGQVFSWGSNSFRQLGYSEKNTLIHSRLTPKRVDALRYQVVAEIAASGCHSAAIDANDGALYTWGSNRRGQLGRKERCGTDQTDATPRSVDALCLRHSMCVVYGDYDSIRAEKIALSDWHTIVVLRCAHNGRSLGQVWQFGYGSYRPSRVNITSAVSTIVTGSVMCDTWIPTCKQRDLDILDVSCAQNHSIALSACGSVFTWGHNAPALSHQSSNISRNKCAHLSRNGVPPIPSPSAPQKVLLATYGPVTSVCAFQDHCAVVTQQGDLVTWGCGQQGVLGHGRDNTWQPKPKRVKGVKKAVAVAAGHQHMAVLVAPLHPEFSTITDDTSCCQGVVPSLVTLVESKIAAYVDIMNCASVWHHAERYAAVRLSRYCVEYMQYNWDAVLDSVGRDRMELLYDLMLPPVQDLNLEEKSLSVEVVEKPGKKKRSAKRPTKEIKNEPTPLIATSKEPPTVCQRLVTVASLESISIKSSSTSNKATRHRKSRNSKFPLALD